MDYFLMNECIFKILIKKQKDFIITLLKTLNINIDNYLLFDLNIPKKNNKIDIILIADLTIINIELNKEEKSLRRNKIFLDTLTSLLPEYNIIQININLFPTENKYSNIYNYYKDYNEYIKFITTKDYQEFKTNNKLILDTIKYLNTLNFEKLKKEIIKEQQIKAKLDSLIKD